MTVDIKIVRDDLSDGRVISLLQLHRQEMLKHSPPESVHALDVKAMQAPNLTFWSAWVEGTIAGCAAIKQLDALQAELKSMKASDAFVGKGVGRALLLYVLFKCEQRGYNRLSLETGTMDVFKPARNLYESAGFKRCEPFGEYRYDEHSVCMTLEISPTLNL